MPMTAWHKSIGDGCRDCWNRPLATPWSRAMDAGGLIEGDAERIYLEDGYLGAALVGQKPVAPYLSKFAVEREAQGDGIGSEIWSLLTRDYPTFFWRAQPSNPSVRGTPNSATDWYAFPNGTSSGGDCRQKRSSRHRVLPGRPARV